MADLSVALALAAFLLFGYLSSYSGVPHNPDEWYYLAGTQTALTDGLRNVQPHGWLFSLMLVPLYLAARVIPGLGSFQASVLTNSVVTAVTAVVLYRYLKEKGLPPGLRAATALVFGLGTLAWPYSRYLFREPAAGLFLLVTVWSIERFFQGGRPLALLLASGAFVCALAIKHTMLAFLPFLALVVFWAMIRHRWSGLSVSLRVIAIAATVAIAVGAVWGADRAGLLAQVLPAYLRQLPDLNTFAALWVSPGWGLFIFAPALILGTVGTVPFIRRAPVAAFVGLGASVFYILASTTNPFWWGYWAFGPRQLVPLLPLLCLPIPFGLRWLKTRWGRWGLLAAGFVIGLSMLIQLLGVLVPFNEYARQVFLRADLTGPAITWRWDLWPIAGMMRFARPALLDIAWLAGRSEATIAVRWPILAPLLTATLLSGLWLWYLVHRVWRAAGRVAGWISVALCIAWLPVALVSVRQVYLDERYQPELGFPAAAEAVRQGQRAGDLLITDLWTENLNGPLVAMLNYCRGGCPPRLDLTREDLIHREADWQRTRLADLAGYRRAWLVLERVAEGDPNSIVEQWLGRIGYLEMCRWTGPQVRLCLFGLEPGSPIGEGPSAATFGEAILLRSTQVGRNGNRRLEPQTLRGGEQLLVDLTWEALAVPATNYVASLQLIGPDGRLAAGADVPAGGSFRPSGTWQRGERVTDRRSLTVPDALHPGIYHLWLVLYDPASGQRLPVLQSGKITGDSLSLLAVEVKR